MGSISVCEKLDVVHQVYDPRGGLKYTCTLQNLLRIQLYVQYVQMNLIIIILPVGVQLRPLVCSLLMGSFSVCEKLDVVHQVYDPRVGAQVYMYLSKLAIKIYVHYVQLNLIIIILPVDVQLSPLVCSLWMGSISVCEKLDVVHQLYDPRGGLKYTCNLQN